MNKIMVTGGLTHDSELKQTAQGKSVLSFSLAVSDGQGEYKKTSYWRCSLWGTRAEKLHQYFIKGTRLLVEGKPEIRQYEKQDGTKGISAEIFVTDFEFIGGKKGEAGSNSGNDYANDAGFPSGDEDSAIPF
jgi:single-strand DNA-binding protein